MREPEKNISHFRIYVSKSELIIYTLCKGLLLGNFNSTDSDFRNSFLFGTLHSIFNKIYVLQ
ncbi:hypothetical protein CAPN001_06580 [Capnocytophaga stomatis]|nr:hypothetical protein CAPN002_04260 [Capnocytophaga stomatis]GIJ96089.1 hypothetical protein CAPN001_06580 [Capnocytophaga stomatis]GIM50362.1 hypothetical protein CAPN003_18140 [Capnocytophaga stomatis]